MAPRKFDRKAADTELRYILGAIDHSKKEIGLLLKKAPDSQVVEQINSILNLDVVAQKPAVENLVKDLIIHLDDESDTYTQDEARYSEQLRNFRKEYHRLVGQVQAFVKPSASLTSASTSTSTVGQTDDENSSGGRVRMQVPTIPVPRFDGEPSNFFDFKNLFIRVVHENRDLFPVQKLWYLKDCLKEGSAKSLLKDFELSDAHSPFCWLLTLELERRQVSKSDAALIVASFGDFIA
jgi:hypothetical protein